VRNTTDDDDVILSNSSNVFCFAFVALNAIVFYFVLHVSIDATSKLAQVKTSYGGDRKVYSSVDEFMADRQMLIDLVVARRHNLRVSRIVSKTVNAKSISTHCSNVGLH